MREPQQERSRKTLDRILDAAATILETKYFEELSVAEIVEKAGTSVGAFYGRFADKDALLDALDARYLEGFEAALLGKLHSREWNEGTLEFIVPEAVGLLVQLYDADFGLLRSLNMKARIYGDERFRIRERRAWESLYPALQDLIVVRLQAAGHPDPIRATSFGFRQMFFTMREMLLWEPLRTGEACDKRSLGKELGRAFLAYLDLR
jgi:AcrR family transcriptional regulator